MSFRDHLFTAIACLIIILITVFGWLNIEARYLAVPNIHDIEMNELQRTIEGQNKIIQFYESFDSIKLYKLEQKYKQEQKGRRP